MKKVVMLLFFVFSSTWIVAQGNEQFPLGGKQLNFGPLYAGVDFGVQQNITVGPMISYNWAYYDPSVGVLNTSFDLLGKADYHFGQLLNLPSEWDVYGGLRVGLGFRNGGRLLSGIEVGGRWFWNKKWGLNVESVYGNYLSGNIGVTMKL
ncbi:MAG: hypothetical protein JXR65_04615 [Bacteroidales bacterium]|nr:hypothetical protein [Bacteroidales bacterium]